MKTFKTFISESTKQLVPVVTDGKYMVDIHFYDPDTDEQIGLVTLSKMMTKKEPDYLFMRAIGLKNMERDKGHGYGMQMYRYALNYAKKQGYKGLSSDPLQRTEDSEKFWKGKPINPSGFQTIETL